MKKKNNNPTAYKISLDGYVEMDNPLRCIECDADVSEPTHIIGFGEYPIGGFRNRCKPFHSLAVGIECPKCFTKQCHHVSNDMYESYLMLNRDCD